MAEKQKLHLIGLAPEAGGPPPAVNAVVEAADVLAGGDRLLEMFPDSRAERCRLTTPLDEWLARLQKMWAEGRKVAVLASGDPNYYGLGKKLLTVFSPQDIVVMPAVTSVQIAFARLKTAWDQTEAVSLHGRGDRTDFWTGLYRTAHYGSGRLAVYTDADNSPSVIAKRLLGRGQHNWRMTVFEDLGTPDERITSWSLFEAKIREFSPLNLVLLECLKKPEPVYPGMPEEAYIHEAGLITKREVRMVALGLLALQPRHTLWDLGAGSGAMSIEAAALMPRGSVWAVEKSPLRAEQIAANRAKFGVSHVDIIEDGAMEAMKYLPSPDRIFIGGGGEGLEDIVREAKAHLRPRGLLVVALVSLDKIGRIAKLLRELGLEMSVTQVQIARSEALAAGFYFKPLNQVWLARGTAKS